MKSPGMYVFHVASFFSAMTSPGMMIGASDLSFERYSQLEQHRKRTGLWLVFFFPYVTYAEEAAYLQDKLPQQNEF